MKRFLESAELSEVELGTASSRREERQNADSIEEGGRQGAEGTSHGLGVGGWREVAHFRVTPNERSVSWSDPELSHASWWPFCEQCLSGSHSPLPFSGGFGNDELTYPSRLRGSVFLSSSFLTFLVLPFVGLRAPVTNKETACWSISQGWALRHLGP